MSNRLTTWELKAVDNLPDLIARMQRIVDLMQQQAALSAQNSSAIQGQLSNLSNSYNNLQKQMQGVTAVQQQQVAATNQQAAATRQMQQQYEALRSTAVSLTTIIAGVFSASKAKEFVLEVVDANTRVNLFSKSLEAMLKNKQLADQISAYALEMAQRSPLEVKQIMEVTQRLVAMGAEGGKITTYLEMLGEISSVVGTQKLPLIAKALLDVQNKQKLYAQEIRQFTDNGVPLFQLLADSMNLPIEKVKQLAEQHKISFKDVEKALLDATKQGGIYYGSMARNAEELGGKLSNLSDVVFLAKARFGEFIKEGLGNAITAVSNFIKSITATDAAMERTINAVKAVTTAVVTYTLATRVGAAAIIAKELVMRAYTIAVGTSQMALQALTGAMGAHITINTAATVAARAFWATLAANPIGLVISSVGLVTTAYYTWKATTSEMSRAQEELTERITKGTAPLELSRIEFGKLGATILSTKASAEQKAAALERLQKLYPLQMAGITSLADAESKLGKLMKEVNNDFMIRIKLLENEVRAQVNTEAATAAVREKIKLEGQLATASTKRAEVYGTAGKMEVYSDAEVIQSRINKLNKTIAEAQKYNDNIATQSERLTKEINDDWTAKTATRISEAAAADDDANKKKKAKAILTAKEIAVLTKEIQADSFKDQLALVDAQMKLDIDRVNHSKLTKAQAEAAIVEIVRKAEAEKTAMRAKFAEFVVEGYKEEVISSRDMTEAVKFDLKEQAKEKKKTEQEKRDETRKTVQEWQSYQKEIQRITKETAAVEAKSRNENLQLLMTYLGSLGQGYADVARIGRRVIDDIDLLSGKTKAAAADQLMHNQKLAEDAARIFGAGTEQYNQARVRVAESQKELATVKAAASTATLGIAMMVFDTFKNVAVAINQSIIETNKAIIENYERVKRTVSDFYETIIQNSEQSFKIELENFKGSYQEKTKIIERHYALQLQYAEGRDLITAEATRAQKRLEIQNDFSNNIWGSQKKDMANLEKAIYGMQAFEDQIRIQKLEREIENAAKIRDAKLDALDAEMKAFRAAKEEEVRIENEALDARLKKNDEFYSDKQIRLVNDDVYRAQLLREGEIREVAALEAAKQRELDRATQAGATAEEIARIKESFDKSIAQVHKKYQDAIGDKEKEISLANIESKNQETDTKNKLESDSANTIKKLKQELADKDALINNQMKAANDDYKNAVNKANRDIFEISKKMKIAELMAEIAILKGKRNLFNKGKIDSAIDDLNAAIGNIRNLNFDGGASAAPTPDPGVGIPEDGNSNPGGPSTEDPNANPNGFFDGTPYIEGLGYPAGRDTVPAMVNKGERIMQTHLNELIGGRAVSNEELAAKKLFADRVLGKVADIRGMLKRETFLAPLPSYMMQGVGSGAANLDEIANRIEAAMARPAVQVTVNPRGLSVQEKGQRKQNEIYYRNTAYYRNY